MNDESRSAALKRRIGSYVPSCVARDKATLLPLCDRSSQMATQTSAFHRLLIFSLVMGVLLWFGVGRSSAVSQEFLDQTL
jgi:hypothetical protein|eukprot:CAMPEP_0181213820 /NCGR_PEP_ID=MMETSP1096-20121128/25115_1 /TAXON_ID=156174 ORGANISM="Chrysochromulina ericina, Strain CCMP281" /NCGR_SAMPLE_ID=MMETSP1096 /ASSEMBLY_ACC=CAM_ASM_000453 /LENGTH=79 /DNA_ID=CAMNT_0023305497 /DNA_START=52 /DNA_END=291 /DNA_ORIENTATION=-